MIIIFPLFLHILVLDTSLSWLLVKECIKDLYCIPVQKPSYKEYFVLFNMKRRMFEYYFVCDLGFLWYKLLNNFWSSKYQ